MRTHFFVAGITLLGGCLSTGIIEVEKSTTTGSASTTATTETTSTTSTSTTTSSATTSTIETTLYDEVVLRIVSPDSGEFLALGETHTFEAELVNPDGTVVDYDEIVWSSSYDSAWLPVGALFEDATLDVGVHDITAEVELPNGDRLAHTVGGVLLQSVYAGTYSGLFSSSTEYQGFPLGCSGVANLVVDPYGETVIGDASCVAMLYTFEVELAYLFEIENSEGDLFGVTNADLFGVFEWPFDSEGALSEDGLMEFAFGDDLGDIIMEGTVEAERVSLDAGL